MKILLGVDTSEHARETVSLLCRMAWPNGTQVEVLSVIAPSEPQFAPTPAVLAAVAGNLARIENRELEQHDELIAGMEKRLREAGFDVTARLESGDPRHVLVDEAGKWNADLLVIGCHEHHGFRRFGMGCVSSYVATHAPCNVLVVRHDTPEIGRIAGAVEAIEGALV